MGVESKPGRVPGEINDSQIEILGEKLRQHEKENQDRVPRPEAEAEEEDVVPFPTITSNPLTPESDVKSYGKKEYPFPSYHSYNSNDDHSYGISYDSSNPERSSSLINLLAAYEKPPSADKDAGNKSQNHYKNKLPGWRNDMRNAVLPLIRWETPYLAALQRRSRNVVLDLYFALTANLGTHTFYVIILPLGYWLGIMSFARSAVFNLAFGVYFTGVIKDLLCLPRPLSPPLHRITMSGSAALEYGFPSTHSANAVSIGLLVLSCLRENRDSFSTFGFWLCIFMNTLYVFSIVWGRIHCGMHGFCDVVVGSIIGIALWWIRDTYGAAMDAFLLNPDSFAPILVSVPILLLLVWVHPEPADDCPCYDDAVAFIGVVIGVCIGQWHYSRAAFSDGAIPFDFSKSGIIGTLLRLIIGILLIGVWRPIMKRALHAALPPIYRFIARVGITLPRKYFMPASQYEDVPTSISDSTFFEPYQLTSMFSTMSKARRSDSVGPQSTADIYETLAYREYQRQRKQQSDQKPKAESSALDDGFGGNGGTIRVTPPSSSSHPNHGDHHHHGRDGEEYNNAIEDDGSENITSTLVVPRTRYDVEVVTKLIVYAGISIIATDFCGVLYIAMGI